MKNMNQPKSNEIFFLFQFQQKLRMKRKIESPINKRGEFRIPYYEQMPVESPKDQNNYKNPPQNHYIVINLIFD